LILPAEQIIPVPPDNNVFPRCFWSSLISQVVKFPHPTTPTKNPDPGLPAGQTKGAVFLLDMREK